MGPNRKGHLIDPTGLGQWPDMHGKAGRPCGISDTGLSHPGQLIDSAGNRTLARVARDFWSNPRCHGLGPESPGKSDSHRGPLFTVPCLPGLLIDPVSTRTRARVAGTVGQTRGPLDTVANHLGQLVDIAGSLT